MREWPVAACGAFSRSCPQAPASCGCSLEARPDCPVLLCCAERGLEHCGLCGDFPCTVLQAFVPEDRPEYAPGYHVENLRRRSWIGTRAWLWEQGLLPPADPAERRMPAVWM